MKQKIRLKKKCNIKFNKKSFWLISLLLVFIITWSLIHFIGNVLNPSLMKYAEIETKRLALDIINDAVSTNVTNILEENELFQITKNEQGEVQTIDFNSVVVNKILQEANQAVQEQLRALEAGDIDKFDIPEALETQHFDNLKNGIVCEIPLGVVTGNSLLANIGPRFPVRLFFVGDVISNVNTKISDYGINNAIVEVTIQVEVTERIVLPFITKEIKILTDVPIAIKMLQGKVPNYYGNVFDKNSSLFSLPLQ